MTEMKIDTTTQNLRESRYRKTWDHVPTSIKAFVFGKSPTWVALRLKDLQGKGGTFGALR